MDTKATVASAPHLDWITRYRGFLITAVLLIHVGITYGAKGGWYFTQSDSVFWLAALATLVCALSQSFTLGAFFFISAYFLADQARRKGIKSLLVDKLLRLGLPFLFYYFVLNSLTFLAAENLGYGHNLPFKVYGGSGPLWFVEALLIFTFAWAAYAALRPSALAEIEEARQGPATRPRARAIGAYILVAAAAGFLARLAFPIGWSISNLQLGYFPMYIALFAIGAEAGRRKWLEGIGSMRIRPWAALAALLVLAFPLAFVLGGGVDKAEAFLGGASWQAAFFALWEAAVGTSLFIVSIVAFARRAGIGKGPFLRYAKSSFGVYQFHAPVIVLAAILMKDVPVHPALKYLALLATGTLLPWALTEVLRIARPMHKFL